MTRSKKNNANKLKSWHQYHSLEELASMTWLQSHSLFPLDPSLISHLHSRITQDRSLLSTLELCQCLEKYLIPYYTETREREWTELVLFLSLEKIRQRLAVWSLFPDSCPFFNDLIQLYALESLEIQSQIIGFLAAATFHLEVTAVRQFLLSLSSMQILFHVQAEQRQRYLDQSPPLLKYKKLWQQCLLKREKWSEQEREHNVYTFLPRLMEQVKDCIEVGNVSLEGLEWLIRTLDWFSLLLSQWSTRRHLPLLFQPLSIALKQCHWCQQHSLLFQTIQSYFYFLYQPLDPFTGQFLTPSQSQIQQEQKIGQCQLWLFQKGYKKVACLSHSQFVQDLKKWVEEMNETDRNELFQEWVVSSVDAFLDEFQREPIEMAKSLQQVALFPTETRLFHPLLDRTEMDSNAVDPLPRLTLQYLSVQDYLMRHFQLYRLESEYAIKQELNLVLERLQPFSVDQKTNDNTKSEGSNQGWPIYCRGWAKMAHLMSSLTVLSLGKESLYGHPLHVRVQVVVALENEEMRKYWKEQLFPGSSLFLVAVQGKVNVTDMNVDNTSLNPFRVTAVRGAHFLSLQEHLSHLTLLLELDPLQYVLDRNQATPTQSLDTFLSHFNLVMIRKAKENTFYSILETVQKMMEKAKITSWLEKLVLGYGDPLLKDIFNGEVKFKGKASLKLNNLSNKEWQDIFQGRRIEMESEIESESKSVVIVNVSIPADWNEPVQIQVKPDEISFQPYEMNSIPSLMNWTLTQSKALFQSLSPGLSLIVGGPGTGKSLICSRLLALFSQDPTKKTLLMTRTNHALNHLFQQLSSFVPSRYLLRLGQGNQALEESYQSKGRWVALMKWKEACFMRFKWLAQCQGQNLLTPQAVPSFFKVQIIPKWHQFMQQCDQFITSQEMIEKFPFENYFSDSEIKLSPDEPISSTRSKIMSRWEHLQEMFDEWERISALDWFPMDSQKVDYLLVKEARIVAMTSTYYAIKKSELAALNCHFDHVIIEEASQMLELESILPLIHTEQGPSHVTLLGDDQQLPPVVKFSYLSQVSHFDESLFMRLLRLGCRRVLLTAQGRSRPSLASLMPCPVEMTHLSHVYQGAFIRPNAGFLFPFQFIDCPGSSESQPLPYFYQNLMEAEMIAALYSFMLSLNYPRDKITILCMYNGQKALIQEILERRGYVENASKVHISTVDQYQGQENDYVLLSLVRTQSLGYLRDLRRWRVALSRARLGLYVFGHRPLFMRVKSELQQILSEHWSPEQSDLMLVPEENWNESVHDEEREEKVWRVKSVEELGKWVYEHRQK